MSNKKIAVVFAGQPRSFRYCYESHLQFFKLDGYDFDFFIHAWADQWYHPKTKSELTRDNPFDEDVELLEKELVEIYKPKSIKVELQRKNEELTKDMSMLLGCRDATKNWHIMAGKNNDVPIPFGGKDADDMWMRDATHAGQIYSWQRATNLKTKYEKETSTEYDATIRFRLDNLISNANNVTKIRLMNEICNDPEDKERIMFQWQLRSGPGGKWHVGDMFFAGKNKLYDTLMGDIYVFLIKRWLKAFSVYDGHFVHPGPPEGILAQKLAYEELCTGVLAGVDHVPYREYMIDHPTQTVAALRTLSQELHIENKNAKK